MLKKLLIVFALVIAPFVAQAQNGVVSEWLDNDGEYYSVRFSDLDSLENDSSGWMQWNPSDNGTIFMADLFSAGSGGDTITRDSVKVIIQTRTKVSQGSGTTGFIYNVAEVDTQLVIGRSGVIANIRELTLTGKGSEYRVRLSIPSQEYGNRNDRDLRLTFYMPKRDSDTYMHRRYPNISP